MPLTIIAPKVKAWRWSARRDVTLAWLGLRCAGLVSKRQMGMARLAKAQLLSEWRVANEMLKQMTKAGLKVGIEGEFLLNFSGLCVVAGCVCAMGCRDLRRVRLGCAEGPMEGC